MAPLSLAEARREYLLVRSEYEDELASYNQVARGDGNVDAAWNKLQAVYTNVLTAYGRMMYAWREENPIRIARRQRHLAAHVVATQVKISHPTIHSWEIGSVVTPSIVGMRRLAEFFNDPDLPAAWGIWRASEPSDPLPSPPRRKFQAQSLLT